ncbi:MAG: hypothetical protein K9H14_00370 [Actinomycetia bacterium]|nr:hypothetical protein [Actinomycetes bacterium]
MPRIRYWLRVFLGIGLVFLLLPGGRPVYAEVNNLPSIVSGPEISKTHPVTTDNLSVNYGYFDLDNDAEDGSIIKWYKVGSEDPVVESIYENQNEMAKVLQLENTSKGEQWYATAQPRDGQALGEIYTSNTVTILNSPPNIIGDIVITPDSPETSEDLTVNYSFYDFDAGDTESGTEIRWYRDGTLVSDYNDLMQIPAEATDKDQQWKVTVKPGDGQDWGSLYESGTVTIVNTPPYVDNAAVCPGSPGTQDPLKVSYDFHHPGGNEESGTSIRWYRDGTWVEDLNDLIQVPGEQTRKGQSWYATITPSDGTDTGETVTTANVDIINTGPSLLSLNIEPASPQTGDNLSLSYQYSDADGDSQGDTRIKWYRDGSLVESLNGLREIESSQTREGQNWEVSVELHDGFEYGEAVRSDTVTIRAAAKSASSPSSAPPPVDKVEKGVEENKEGKPADEIRTTEYNRKGNLYGKQEVALKQGKIKVAFDQKCRDREAGIECETVKDKSKFELAGNLNYASEIYRLSFNQISGDFHLSLKYSQDAVNPLLTYWSSEEGKWVIIRDATAAGGIIEADISGMNQMSVCVVDFYQVTGKLQIPIGRQAVMAYRDCLLRFVAPDWVQDNMSLEVKTIQGNNGEMLLPSVLDRYKKPLKGNINIKVLCSYKKSNLPEIVEMDTRGQTRLIGFKTVGFKVMEARVLAGRFLAVNSP